MKKPICILILLSFLFNTNAQQFEGIIKFENTVIYKNEKDSIKYTQEDELMREKFGVSPNDHKAYKAEAYLKKDSCLVVKYYFQPDTPDFYVLNAGGKVVDINLKTGRQLEYKYYFKFRYPPYKIKKKVRNILGYDCTLYKAENETIRSEIWVAHKLNVDTSQKAFSHFMHNGKMILEQTSYAKLPRITRQTKAVEIKEQKINKIFIRIKEYAKLDDTKRMYADIEENANVNVSPIKVGDIMPELHYREVKDLDLKSLGQFKGNGKFLMLEFWGTWCAPCLYLTPKVKEFAESNKQKLDLLSINWGDRTYKRVLDLIKEKEMNWNHGFGTKKLMSTLNPTGYYPMMVLLDDDFKVLLIGNPGTELDEATKLIK
jgi:thiol-disulfide isomerase/thioredoxin